VNINNFTELPRETVLKLFLSKHHTMKMYPVLNKAPCYADIWGNGSVVSCILNLGTGRGEWSASCPGCFTLRERAPSTHWIRGWWAAEPVWT